MEKVFRIHEAAEKLGIHINTIKSLEQRGIVQPERSLVGHRIFSERDLKRIREFYEQKTEE
jgi:DNA-binding transcriptional MerR regulator